MAVNPNIALSVRGLELPDPLAQYGKVQAIQSAQQQNALAQMKMQQTQREVEQRNMLNQAYSQAYTPEGLDYNKLVSSLATGGLGSQIPEIEKQRQAALKAQSETTGAQLGVEKQRSELLNNVKRQMSLNPSDENIRRLGQQVIATGLFPAEVVNEELAAILQTPVEERQRLLSMSGAGVSDLAPSVIQVNRGGQTDLVRSGPTGEAETVATYGDVPLTPEAEAQKRRIAQAGVQPVQRTYDERVMKSAADRDMALVESAQALPTQVNKLDQALNVLESGQPFTGALSELELAVGRLRSKYTQDKEAGVRVTDTEYLNSLLGSDVFQQIDILGIGARGLDTPAEREFLRQVISGTTALNKDTLIRMLENRRNALTDMAEKYNTRLREGRLDAYLQVDPGASKQPVEIPKRTPRQQLGPVRTPPAEAIDMLRANNSAQYRKQFDEIFGEGAAERVLGGGR